MKFEWSEYYNLAKELADTNSVSSGDLANNPKLQTSEAKLRSSISRAYYGAFCIARNYLRDVLCDSTLSGSKRFDVNEHQYVSDKFIKDEKTNKKIVRVGSNLNRLRGLRNKADYEDIYNTVKKDALFALKLAEDIITKINELIK